MIAPCRCRATEALDGDDGIAYARDHLRLEAVAEDGWSATWTCPETGLRWRETYAPVWRPSDGGERLERLDPPGSPGPPALPPPPVHRGHITRWSMAAVSATLIAALLLDAR